MDINMDLDDFNRDTAAFLHWLRQSGASISDKIAVEDLRSQGAGRGVVAKIDIDEDELLFTVPRTAILSPETSALPDHITSSLDDPWLSLILNMVYEHQQGSDSKWQPYFDILPKSFDTLMFWDESELAFLKGSAVLGKIGKEAANETFTTQLLPIIRSNAKAFRAEKFPDETLLALCHRMGSTIMAYAFDLEAASPPTRANDSSEEDGWEIDSDPGLAPTPKGMIPLADLLNANASLNNAKLYHTPGAVEMRSLNSISAGSEILNDYGALPRADLLRRYGYTTERYAPYDTVEIPSLQIFPPSAQSLQMSTPELQSRLAYLESQDVLDSAYDLSHPDPHDPATPFPEELIVALNTVCLSNAEFKLLRSKDKLPKCEPTEKTCGLLREILARRREDYPQNFRSGQDHAAGREGFALKHDGSHQGVAKKRMMAQQVIQGELDILHEAREWVESNERSLVKKRYADEHPDEVRKMKKAKR